ncbi:hypothetical protein [Helicobacter winghamensis]|uniref:Uncharacterized protein n=2 Tax=Helicobacter winghamensis TaxID=157268 RepID=A0A2N3PK35_9HELI|nr:hypothetical protein [Helicobacter winghamensis]EEO25854.1 hypothetical protein HWAG_00646 [Helicobacter winghamensis ATCC BAA-430]PKT76898.1 hypothetical protein BCM34_06870 [Helicobacter winghamensis]PKT77038.1 hypothetical protein BCM35_02955 [Helicobacter winghamensis]PKT77561.1 hypothetical protein BCM32_05025 [Helicobacter winghamensis]PKT81800.1 hypothetical protein BCM31_01020 [Helicobacter winghamensis]
MVSVLKVIISLGIAMAWYQLTANQETAIFFFVLMLGIFFIRPIAYQSQTEREEFIEKYRRSKERQRNLEKMRQEEKKKALEEKKKRMGGEK